MKILQAGDRPGWAIDRLSKPVAELYPDEVTMSYFNLKEDRFLASGYTPLEGNTQFSLELANKFDVVHFHHYVASHKMAQQLNKGIKKVLSIHTERPEDLAEDFSMFDVLIASTKHNLEILSKNHPNVVLVPVGIDLSKYKYTFENRDGKTVGFVGRIMKHKRFEVILSACIQIGYKMLGCGYVEESEYYYKYQHEADQKGLLNWVNLLPEGNMQEIYNKMGVYVCLSEPEIETGPLPVLEAMACGVPVISTQVGWIKDWGKDGTHYLKVYENGVDQVGATIKVLEFDPQLKRRIIANGLRLIQDFGIDKYAAKLMEVYKA